MKIEDLFIKEQDFAEVMDSKVLPFLKKKTKNDDKQRTSRKHIAFS